MSGAYEDLVATVARVACRNRAEAVSALRQAGIAPELRVWRGADGWHGATYTDSISGPSEIVLAWVRDKMDESD